MFCSKLQKKSVVPAQPSRSALSGSWSSRVAPISAGRSAEERTPGLAPRFSYRAADIQVNPAGQGVQADGSLSVHPAPEDGNIFMDDEPKGKSKSPPAKPPEKKPEQPAPAKAACPP